MMLRFPKISPPFPKYVGGDSYFRFKLNSQVNDPLAAIFSRVVNLSLHVGFDFDGNILGFP